MRDEPEFGDEIKKPLEPTPDKSQFGPTGRFPDGKITGKDEGEIRVGITTFNSRVIVNFGKPIRSLGLTVEQARRIAFVLNRRANEIERGQK